jgi:hypothetical protein
MEPKSMAKPTSRRPLELGIRAKDVLHNILGPNFTKEMVRSLDLKTLSEAPECGRYTLEEILAWSQHPEQDDFLDQDLIEKQKTEDHLAMEMTYRAIGRFVHGFSFLEFALRFWLSDMIKLEPKFQNVVITHDFSLLCTAVVEVCRETMEPETFDRLKTPISRSREFNDLRVKVVHGLWIPFREGGTLLHVSRQSLKDYFTNEMAGYLEQQAELMHSVTVELTAIFLRATNDPDVPDARR